MTRDRYILTDWIVTARKERIVEKRAAVINTAHIVGVFPTSHGFTTVEMTTNGATFLSPLPLTTWVDILQLGYAP